MEIKNCAELRERLLNSTDYPETQQNYEDEDEDEAISLRNLPLIHHEYQQNNTEEEHTTTTTTQSTLLEAEDDFNFWSPEEESEMRAADEIFFRGQILPQNKYKYKFQHHITRSQSMDHYFSADLIRSSSSSSSHHTSSFSTAAVPRNQFHSHPSPSPRIVRNSRQQIIRNNNRINCVQKSLSWNVFRGGLIAAPPEITASGDLKSRCSGKNRAGREKKKRGKAWDIVGGCNCKCSVDDAIIDATVVSPQIAIVKRSVNHRTSEWLKQLSLQRTPPPER